ncbi:unnamed protein product [Closterium sp. Naga37s-1]|nr:unnamed protein product [Closterium sp. Naga37s-1]
MGMEVARFAALGRGGGGVGGSWKGRSEERKGGRVSASAPLPGASCASARRLVRLCPAPRAPLLGASYASARRLVRLCPEPRVPLPRPARALLPRAPCALCFPTPHAPLP